MNIPAPSDLSALSHMELQYEIEQFYFAEAALLETGRYEDWLATFSDDIRYWMPVRETHRDRSMGFRGEGEMAIFDDDLAFLSARVERWGSTLAHAEIPPSRLRYFISNIRLVRKQDSVNATCSFLVNQTRLENLEFRYVGERQDQIRLTAEGWKVSLRRIVLDQATIPRSLTVFF